MVCMVAVSKDLKLLDSIQLIRGTPTTFLEKLKIYCIYNSSFILNPTNGIKLFTKDFFNNDQRLLTECQYPEMVIEGLRDSRDQCKS